MNNDNLPEFKPSPRKKRGEPLNVRKEQDEARKRAYNAGKRSGQ